jgi:CDP-glucose 4,6-dehydratase
MVNRLEFWRDKSVLVTGHTGFKGSWLCLLLQELGARVTGYALPPETDPSHYDLLGLQAGIESVTADVRDPHMLETVVERCQPDAVFHLAAQSLVRRSYTAPVYTFETNVLGTVNLLEAVRNSSGVRAVVSVTSDKCYENRETLRPYVEGDRLGGHDPYSNSKACAELVTQAYRDSFSDLPATGTARAGNVIGGGDWSDDRLVPDLVRAAVSGAPLLVRNPEAVRPWQFVLEPLMGYLHLARSLAEGGSAAEAWNFGPPDSDACTVQDFLNLALADWPAGPRWECDRGERPHEARLLLLESGKAIDRLGWRRHLGLHDAAKWTIDWYRAWLNGADMASVSRDQVGRYLELERGAGR